MDGRGTDYQYRAFLSYSRHDREVARRLQNLLERYVLPTALRFASPATKRSKRALAPIFRDEFELVPGQDLPARIRHGLEQSEYLLVVCSPKSAHSEWVQREILDFVGLGRGDRILAIVVEGAPNAATPQDEALPRALRYRIDPSGKITDEVAEPLWVDWRGNARHDRRNFLRIVAALLALTSLDELVRRDAAARRQAVLLRTAAVISVLAATTGLSGIAIDRTRATFQARSDRLADLAQKANEREAFESAARFALLGTAGATDPVLGFDGSRAMAELARSVQSSHTRRIAMFDAGRWIEGAKFSPSGKRIVTLSEPGTIEIWTPGSATPVATWVGRRAVISEDGRRVATVSGLFVDLWDVETGEKVGRIKLRSGPSVTVGLNIDGRIIAVANKGVLTAFSEDGRVLSTIRDAAVERLRSTDSELSSDGSYIVTYAGNEVHVWDLRTGRLKQQFKESNTISSARLSADGQRLVTVVGRGAGVWDIATSTRIELFPNAKTLTSAHFSPDGSRVVTTEGELLYFGKGDARVWDARTGDQLLHLQGHDDMILASAFNSDGRRIVTAGRDGTANVWDAVSGRLLAQLRGHGNTVAAASFSTDSKKVVTASLDGTARIWNVREQTELRRFAGHDINGVTAVSFAPDGRRIASAGWDYTVRLWDVESGSELRKFQHDDAAMSVAFTKDGLRLLTASADKTARLWSVETGRELSRFVGHQKLVSGAWFSPAEDRILTASWDKTARVWDVKTGSERIRLVGHEQLVNYAAFSPDGAHVATTSEDNTVRVWDANSGREIKRINGDGGRGTIASDWDLLTSARFCPDGRQLLILSSLRGVSSWQIWNFETMARVGGYAVHHEHVTSAAFSRTCEQVLTSSYDHSARLWDTRSGAELAKLDHDSWVTAAEFDDANELVATGAYDNRVAVWDVRRAMLRHGPLVGYACNETLAGKVALLDQDEMAELPSLDRTRDFLVEGNVCQIRSPWARMLGIPGLR